MVNMNKPEPSSVDTSDSLIDDKEQVPTFEDRLIREKQVTVWQVFFLIVLGSALFVGVMAFLEGLYRAAVWLGTH